MSNKIVPTTYRAVIDDVIQSVKADFESFGVDESVLADLHNRWQHKVVSSHVADFEPLQPAAPPAAPPTSTHPLPAYNGVQIKHEPQDAAPGPPPQQLYAMPPGAGLYAFPPQLRGPLPPGARPGPVPPYMIPTGQHQGVLVLPRGAPPPPAATNGRAAVGAERIPQTDGPARAPHGVGNGSAAGPSVPPAAQHPSLAPPAPRPVVIGRSEQTNDAINSDLDDSDSGEEDGVDAEGAVKDIVFCTYDKVARVKNKWKCVLKDGVIHVNGKDYLFSKCTGEFEW